MKIHFILFLSLFSFLFSCDSGDDAQGCNNNILPNKPINASINLINRNLNFATSTAFIIDNRFITGVFIRNNNGTDFTVFELTEPNKPIGSCTHPSEITGTNLVFKCGEIETKYDIILGINQGDQKACALRRYRATRNGDQLIITF